MPFLAVTILITKLIVAFVRLSAAAAADSREEAGEEAECEEDEGKDDEDNDVDDVEEGSDKEEDRDIDDESIVLLLFVIDSDCFGIFSISLCCCC